jgi:nucleotide-binding universal stress UspA family protein
VSEAGPVLTVLGAAEHPVEAGVLALAGQIARAEGAPLAAMSAEAPPRDMALVARAAGVSEAEAARRLEAALAARLGALCADAVPQEAREVRLGKPFIEIIRTVRRRQARLLIKRAEELPGWGAPLFASTDQHLLRKCPCPVWLWRGDRPRRPRALLAAVDLSDDAERALNLAIVETAARIAAPEGAEIRLLHAWRAEGEGMAWLWSDDPGAHARYLRETEAEHARALRAFEAEARARLTALGLGRVLLRPALRRGAARQVIPAEAAGGGDAEVLVMGTLSRSGVPGLLIGNTAEDVLNSVAISVVTVKPPGYESPIA